MEGRMKSVVDAPAHRAKIPAAAARRQPTPTPTLTIIARKNMHTGPEGKGLREAHGAPAVGGGGGRGEVCSHNNCALGKPGSPITELPGDPASGATKLTKAGGKGATEAWRSAFGLWGGGRRPQRG